MNNIYFATEDTKYRVRNKKLLRNWLNKAVFVERTINILFVNFIICSDEKILYINNKYLNHNYHTDIITFQYSEPNFPIEADIYIGIDTVKLNAQQYGVYLEQELHRVMVHGILHTLGYNDKTDREKAIMHSKEDAYLEILSKMAPRGTIK